MLLPVQICPVSVPKAEPGHRVGEPAQQHQLTAIKDARRSRILIPGVSQQQAPTGPSKEEGGVVDHQSQHQVPRITGADLGPGGVQVNVEAGCQKIQESPRQPQGNQGGEEEGPAVDGHRAGGKAAKRKHYRGREDTRPRGIKTRATPGVA